MNFDGMFAGLKEFSITIGVIVGSIYLLSEAKDYKHEHEWQRQYVLEDRKDAVEKRKAALIELRSCYQHAEENYSVMWGKACRSWNNQKLNECFAHSVPENTCRSNFVYSEECELPPGRADRADSYRDSLKSECRTMFILETGEQK